MNHSCHVCRYFFASFLLLLASPHLFSEESKESRDPDVVELSREDCLELPKDLAVHFEWPFMSAEGVPFPIPKDLPVVKSMADATLEVCKSLKTYEGGVVLTRVGHSGCLLRPTQTPEGQRRLDLLDLPVSLHIEKATTWEAIKELALTVSRNENAEGMLQIVPIYQLMGAPSWFFEDRTVNVEFKSTSARDVLIAIIEQAPKPIRYAFTANTRNRSKEYVYGFVILDFPGTEKDQERRFGNSERTEWWQGEKSDAWMQLKDAWRRTHKKLVE